MATIIGEVLTIILGGGLIVVSVYFIFNKKHHQKLLILTPVYIVMAIGIVTIIVQNINYNNEYLDIYQVEPDDSFDLVLIRNEERNYLYNLETSKEVVYRNLYEEKTFELKKWHPIYMNETENYYIVVFSRDKDNMIEYDRFLQGDYERHVADKLYMIDKETGYIFSIEEHELISKEIDLTSFQEGKDAVFFGIYLAHENNIAYYYYINILPQYSLETARTAYENLHFGQVNDWDIPLVHFHTPGDPSEIIDFKVVDKYIYVKDSYGNAYIGYYLQNQYDMAFYIYETINEEGLAKNGYLKLTNYGIFYVGMDHNLYKTLYMSNSIIVEEDVPLDDWENYIPIE